MSHLPDNDNRRFFTRVYDATAGETKLRFTFAGAPRDVASDRKLSSMVSAGRLPSEIIFRQKIRARENSKQVSFPLATTISTWTDARRGRNCGTREYPEASWRSRCATRANAPIDSCHLGTRHSRIDSFLLPARSFRRANSLKIQVCEGFETQQQWVGNCFSKSVGRVPAIRIVR